MIKLEVLLTVVALLLIVSVLASKASNRTGIPALLLFLVIGMLAGSEGFGKIEYDNPLLTQSVGVVALTFILFSGGLDTNWSKIRGVLGPSLLLANLGVLISTALMGVFAMFVLGFPLLEGLLLGAIVSSTDAAAVFSVMQSRDVQLRHNIEPLVELESGTNDPVAVFLTIGLIEFLTHGMSVGALVLDFGIEMLVGAVAGYGFGRAMVFIVNRIQLRQEGLYPVLTIALMLLTYGGTTLLHGNGFLAVYIAGLVLGNAAIAHRRSILHFHDGIAWLMQIAMFLTLGLQVFPSQIVPVAGVGLLIAGFLLVVARPASVFLSLAFTRFTLRDKVLIAWMGLRGAVPIVLATYPLLAGLPRAGLIFNLVFFIVLSSVLLQGTTIPQLARWLGLEEPQLNP
jgi:cell volume regulation protein A